MCYRFVTLEKNAAAHAPVSSLVPFKVTFVVFIASAKECLQVYPLELILMSALKKLHSARTVADVAVLLGFKTKTLSYLIYAQPDSLKYEEFDIPKKSGGVRRIAAPKGGLKLLQKRLANLLQDCLDEINNIRHNEGAVKPFNEVSHGFKRKLSIRTNAGKHRHRRYVFNIDLADFFGSINFGRVRGFFIKDKRFHLHPKVATILAQIACYKQSLPQGSPCSPVISNLIGNILDRHLVKLAARVGCTYTRYADDLTFSTNKRQFPPVIAIQSDKDSHVWIPGSELLQLVKHSGFEINPKKTRMQYCCSRQEVTGLVVNKKVNIRNEYRRNVQAMVHHLFTKGSFCLPTYEKDLNGCYSLEKKPGNLNQLHGKLGFIDSIDQDNEEISSESNKSPDKKKRTTYRRFLFYKEFYVASKPVLICEGWTDYVYIENALRQLASNYPSLVLLDGDGKSTFKVKRFKYNHTAEIIGIKGGSGDLKNFITSYKNEFKHFSAHGMEEPVILLVDNDQAGTELLKVVNNIAKKRTQPRTKIDRKEPHIHVYRNLYLIFTPLQDGKADSKIEDLFDDSTLEIKIDGKSFDPSNEKVTETTYSKAVFAKEVVEKMAPSISFERFIPLLDQIVKVIQSHYALRK